MERDGRICLLLLLLFAGACRSVPSLAERAPVGLTPTATNSSTVERGAVASTAAAMQVASGEAENGEVSTKLDDDSTSSSSDNSPETQSDEQATSSLEPPPLEQGDLQFPINLAAALQLADARPLIVAAAQASAWQAEAQFQKARVLWLPDFYSGFDYTRHDGYGPDTRNGSNVPQGTNAQGQSDPGSFGTPLNQNINYLYAGGAFYSMRAVTDAIFEPLRARQHLDGKRWEIQIAKNDALRLTAQTYFNVHKFRGQYAGALDVVKKGRQLVEVVQALSKDLVPAVEIDRASNLLADMEQQAATARQYWRRSSIDLTQVLRLDPRVIVDPLEADHLQITLIDPSRPLDELMPIGLTYRPELSSYQAQIQEQLVSVRREQMRAFLPAVVLTGFQTPYEMFEFGALGIGQGSKMNNWFPRVDFAPQLLWQADSLGFGNMAMIKRQRSQTSQSIVELYRAQDAVVADVTRAQASMQSAAARVVLAERELKEARINYDGNIEGLKQTKRFGDVLEQIFRPQEAVFALQLLKVAYDRYFQTVAEYNQAQFAMFQALGYPAQQLSQLAPPGDSAPVDTSRPDFLPTVGVGPPPATR